MLVVVGYAEDLSPRIKLDQYLLEAREAWNADNYEAAKSVFYKIVALKVDVPIEVYYMFGVSLLKGETGSVGDYAEETLNHAAKNLKYYISVAGKSGKFYKKALTALSDAEHQRAPAEAKHTEGMGKIFPACGKVWQLGRNTIDWNDTQTWVNSLGDGWRTPTKAELKELYNEVGKTSPIKEDWVWAESRDSSSAWFVDFRYADSVGWNYRILRGNRALAVRSR